MRMQIWLQCSEPRVCWGMISAWKWANASARQTEIRGRRVRLMENGGCWWRAEEWWKHDDVQWWHVDLWGKPSNEHWEKKTGCREVKWKEIGDERLKAEQLGGRENYSRGSNSTEDKEETSVLEITAGDQRRIKTAHSWHQVTDFDFS